MTCKDCVHYAVCDYTSILDEFVEENCKDFKNKEKIISALEKQIPKKPYILNYGGYKVENWHCPNGHIIDKGSRFCKHCGQALDWSDTE